MGADGGEEDLLFHTPTYVLTDRPRLPLEMDGGTTFHFLDSAPADVLEVARAAAAGQDVRIGGGPTMLREFLAAGATTCTSCRSRSSSVVVSGSWDGLEAWSSTTPSRWCSSPSGVTHRPSPDEPWSDLGLEFVDEDGEREVGLRRRRACLAVAGDPSRPRRRRCRCGTSCGRDAARCTALRTEAPSTRPSPRRPRRVGGRLRRGAGGGLRLARGEGGLEVDAAGGGVDPPAVVGEVGLEPLRALLVDGADRQHLLERGGPEGAPGAVVGRRRRRPRRAACARPAARRRSLSGAASSSA